MQNNVSRQDVELRVIEWEERLNKLYSDIQQWLPDEFGYTIDTSGQVLMNEELMKKYGFEPINLPTLRILHDEEPILIFEPRGLWVIGASGRVDVFGKDDTWILVDVSDRFSKGTQWKVTEASNRRSLVDFTKDVFISMISG